jgi:hypothetical protein
MICRGRLPRACKFAVNEKKVAALVGTALFPVLASAFQPLVTDDTGTQGAGGNQLELSYSRFVEKEPDLRATLETLPLTYTRGLTEALDIHAALTYARFQRTEEPEASGAGIPSIGLKWRFYESQPDKLSLAVKPEIRRAFSSSAEDRGLGNGPLNGGVALLLKQGTGFGAVHANLSVNTFRFALDENRELHRDILWRLSVAPVFELAADWKVALDAGLITNPHKAEKATMGYVEIGAIYSRGKDLDFALGLISDVFHAGHRVHAATAGVTWKFQ